MVRSIMAVLVILTTPAVALDQPTVWRDPDTSCAYWLTPQGGIAPRYRRDGLPDCPDARRDAFFAGNEPRPGPGSRCDQAGNGPIGGPAGPSVDEKKSPHGAGQVSGETPAAG